MSSTILYEVVIAVAPEIRDDYLDWLRGHMAQMLAFDGFEAAETYVDTQNDGEITCHYRLRDRAAMKAYLEGPAQAMRADGVNRFGNKISARRRILETAGDVK